MVALGVGKEAFSDYSHRFSPQKFTQPKFEMGTPLVKFEMGTPLVMNSSPDLIDHWLVDWGDGTGGHSCSGAVATASNTYAASTPSVTVLVTAVDGSGRRNETGTQLVPKPA